MAKLQETEARLLVPTYDKLVQELAAKEDGVRQVTSIFEWQQLDEATQHQILRKAMPNKRVFLDANFKATGRYYTLESRDEVLFQMGYDYDTIREYANGRHHDEDIEWAWVSYKGNKLVYLGDLFDKTSESYINFRSISKVDLRLFPSMMPYSRQIQWLFDPNSHMVYFSDSKAKADMEKHTGIKEFV